MRIRERVVSRWDEEKMKFQFSQIGIWPGQADTKADLMDLLSLDPRWTNATNLGGYYRHILGTISSPVG